MQGKRTLHVESQPGDGVPAKGRLMTPVYGGWVGRWFDDRAANAWLSTESGGRMMRGMLVTKNVWLA